MTTLKRFFFLTHIIASFSNARDFNEFSVVDVRALIYNEVKEEGEGEKRVIIIICALN